MKKLDAPFLDFVQKPGRATNLIVMEGEKRKLLMFNCRRATIETFRGSCGNLKEAFSEATKEKRLARN